jgi:alkylated DNA repair protein alkB family protein 8
MDKHQTINDTQHANKMYSSFAEEFSKTRIHPWPCVKKFLSTIPKTSTILDAGCGNGRNLMYAKSLGFHAKGFDICPEFVHICQSKSLDVIVGDLESPITGTYDAILCIAVLHHLTTEDARRAALQNMYDALEPNGIMLVTIWSYETYDAKFPKRFEIGDNNVMWNLTNSRYYYIYDKSNLTKMIEEFSKKNLEAKVTIEWEEQNWNIIIQKYVV